ASNGQAFRQQVLEETGIQINIIEGDDEANMSLLGSCAVLPPRVQANFLLFDIGGGSTEFVRAKQGQCLDSISRKLGVVRLVEAHLHSNPPSIDDYHAMCHTCQQHLAAVETHWFTSQGHQTAPPALVGTAGTVTTLAAIDLDMHDYDANLINNHIISYPRFLQLKQRLLAMSHEERQAMPSIEAGRADLMVAGLAVMDSIFKRWKYQDMKVVDAGLLEGAWLKIYALKCKNTVPSAKP
ncbi:MAG: Ppx/GppA family phosphatase, partial [Mariprofundaceae bacterium]|nr:Ppx/GppA family phosphatase [Mariprofundaceae bacterium]